MNIPNLIRDKIQDYRHQKDYRKWVASGRPIPPPHSVKQKTVKAYARINRISVLIETGTYLGEMVSAVKHVFTHVYSIELSHELYQQAKKKFSRDQHVSIFHGDSSKVLPRILERIQSPCLFWLDSHYSAGVTARGEKDTPILEELKNILDRPVEEHVILIDDARCFTGQGYYPSLAELKEIILRRYPDNAFEIKDDIIRTYKNIARPP